MNETHRPRTDTAAPPRPRPREVRPPLASLQAAAGNRAVTEAIQRAAGGQRRNSVDGAEAAATATVGRGRSGSVPGLGGSGAAPAGGEREQWARWREEAQAEKQRAEAQRLRDEAEAKEQRLRLTAGGVRRNSLDGSSKGRSAGPAGRGRSGSVSEGVGAEGAVPAGAEREQWARWQEEAEATRQREEAEAQRLRDEAEAKEQRLRLTAGGARRNSVDGSSKGRPAGPTGRGRSGSVTEGAGAEGAARTGDDREQWAHWREEREAARRREEAEAAARQREEAEAARQREEAEAARQREQARAVRQREEAAAVGPREEPTAAPRQQEQAETARQREEAETARQREEAEAARQREQARAARQRQEDEAARQREADEARTAQTEQAEQTEQTEAAAETHQAQEQAKTGANETMKKIKQIFSVTNFKKRIDPVDTAVLRGSAPVGSGLRSDGHNTAVQGQFETGVNMLSTGAGLVNDVRGFLAAVKDRKKKGPEGHQADKDIKGKSAGAVTNTLMGTGDVSKATDNGLRNSGAALDGVDALAGIAGGTSVVFSGIIMGRDGTVIGKTVQKWKQLEQHARDNSQNVTAGRQLILEAVLNGLGSAQARLDEENARLAAAAAESDEARAAQGAVQQLQSEIDVRKEMLRGHLAALNQYVIGKQKNKIMKRSVNMGGNLVRAVGGVLTIVTLAGAMGGPAAPITGGVAAGLIGGVAVYKGVKGATKRYNSVRHPEQYARTTAAQEGKEPTVKPDNARRRDGMLEAVKVTKSVEQGERQLMAQELYALAAGPDVPVGAHVPPEIRASARDLLVKIKCGPEKHRQSQEEWDESLNDPGRQDTWEKTIAKQIAS
ncbi:hypothetical protein [Streptomyces sp. enrichment culture]|uniref:hypothetical protein n=1 Tax=Streptomyces sp. enrichment culture TaxID=1795815 RepID=UPI003F55C26E